MLPRLDENNICVLLVYIDEAHSTGWPLGLDDHPQPHANIKDRLRRASEFVSTLAESASVNHENLYFAVDTWENNFANKYHAWPDKYYFVQLDSGVILEKSMYGNKGKKDAKILEDCTDMFERYCL